MDILLEMFSLIVQILWGSWHKKSSCNKVCLSCFWTFFLQYRKFPWGRTFRTFSSLCKRKLPAKPISTVDDFDFGLKIRSCRASNFALCRACKRTPQNFKGGKTKSRGSLLPISIGNQQRRMEITECENSVLLCWTIIQDNHSSWFKVNSYSEFKYWDFLGLRPHNPFWLQSDWLGT